METEIAMKSTTTNQHQQKQHKQKLQSDKKVQRLKCCVQNYDWGRLGRDSEVARLFALNSGTGLHPDKPYAELWIGTHESGPSFVVESRETRVSVGSEVVVSLKSWLARNPHALGDKVLDKWGCELPFLFKVLSISKALSIQAHPDKELARTLHKLYPNLYKDGNHKPEMALAMTEFEALCGFISLEELKAVLLNVPEIDELVGIVAPPLVESEKLDGKDKLKAELKSVFTRLMTASKERISEAVGKLKRRLQLESLVRKLTDKEQLVLELERQYPGDIGVMGAFFLNHVKLKPGEALYFGPNEPHAYLCGECVECMATSDNVVRAGLTPKTRDVQTLCSMLTYKQGFPEILRGERLNPYVTRYSPPFDEFEVDFCTLPQGESAVFPSVPGPSIFLVRFGEGMMHSGKPKGNVITEGDILFAAANTEINITSASELHLYRAGINRRVFQE